MNGHGTAAFLAVSEEAPSNGAIEDADGSIPESLLVKTAESKVSPVPKVGTDEFEKDYEKLVKGDDTKQQKLPVRARIMRRVTMQPSPLRNDSPIHGAASQEKKRKLNLEDPWGERKPLAHDNSAQPMKMANSPENLMGLYVRRPTNAKKLTSPYISDVSSKYMSAKITN